MYKFEVDERKKVFSVYGTGLFTVKECEDFIKEFRTKTKTFNSNGFALVLDCKDVVTNTQDVAPYMVEMAKMYIEVPFKKRFMVVPKSAVATMQLKRVAKDDFYSQVSLVTSKEEALEQFK